MTYAISSIIKLSGTVHINGTVLYQILEFNETHVTYLIKFNLNTTYGPLTLTEEKVLCLNESFSIPFITNVTLKFLQDSGLKCIGSICHVEIVNESPNMVTYYNITINKRLMLVEKLDERTLLFRGGKVIGESRTLLRLLR